MNPLGCPKEPDVLRAAKAGAWPDELRAHAAGCAICHDVALVAGALAVVRHGQAVGGSDVEDASVVWRRAQLRARPMKLERATRPIAVIEAVALTSAAAVVILLLAQGWSELRRLISLAGV